MNSIQAVWTASKKRFHQYLQLERSLSVNSVEAYLADIEKFQQWSESCGFSDPLKISQKQIQAFPQWIADLGFQATSQARIISGVRAFYKFLVIHTNLIWFFSNVWQIISEHLLSIMTTGLYRSLILRAKIPSNRSPGIRNPALVMTPNRSQSPSKPTPKS